jgi:hypothetical protein
LFSFKGVPAEDLITIIAFAEYPIRITIIAVSKVLSVVLLFPARYQMTPDIIRSASILRNAEPEITHIPVKKRAPMAKTPFFTLFADENENLTAKINRTTTRITWKTIPLFEGRPRVFMKNQSNFEEMVTTPGIIPYINNDKSTIEVTNEIENPFQENLNFLK